MEDDFADVEVDNCEDVIYKEVVVIGNGPSGIVLSYILSGNWPYYNGENHPDEMLMTRLRSVSAEKSLIEQDLQFLSQGLEGRSRNPVAVLIDFLNHPYAEQNSSFINYSLLDWRFHPEKAIDHIVIGKGKPGGCWQQLDQNITTISISSWMELPGLSFGEWENSSLDLGTNCSCQDSRPPVRVKIKQIAMYYHDYVRHVKLMKNMRNFSHVKSVRRIKNTCLYSNILRNMNCKSPQWEVEGYDFSARKCFKYICHKVVLATGTSDAHKMIDVDGELNNSDWVFHDLKQFETAVMELKKNQCIKASLDPVLIIGSGLSAADAVLICDRFSLSVLHIFKSYSFLNENKFSKTMYPEYNHVYNLMKNNEQSSDYKALSQYSVLEICRSDKGRRVLVQSPNGFISWYKVTYVAVLTGYLPNLKFLPPEFNNGRTLGVHKGQLIDSQKNPIVISPWTYKVKNSPSGLYAIGPLVGDNVVRVIPGGAVAVASHIVYENKIK